MQIIGIRGQTLLFEAMAYALGGMFLFTIATSLILSICAWAFMTFAVFLIINSLINSLFNRSISLDDRIHTFLSFLLFAVTAVEFISESVKPQQDIYAILAVIFLLLLLLAMLFDSWRVFRKPKRC